MKIEHDLIGIGIGPFNLSLAALLEKSPTFKTLFLERKKEFDWHSEIMFDDSVMQTSYLKDLVTPVDPTNFYSYLNFLVNHQLFYAFLNTQRSFITRKEFSLYCQWICKKLEHKLKFSQEVLAVDFKQGSFHIETNQGSHFAKNICVATGHSLHYPDCTKKYLGENVFHAKSKHLANMNLTGKSVAIIGGGQTGVEIFSNALSGKWGEVKNIQLITRRSGLMPLDESAFTNEFFSPHYLHSFWPLDESKKNQIVKSQKLASDGNTPDYLLSLYNNLYQRKYVHGDKRNFFILPSRQLIQMEKVNESFKLHFENSFTQEQESLNADVVILATGFEQKLPQVLEPLFSRLNLDNERRLTFKKSYALNWDGPAENRIYALNYSRHNHGIADPQTSLMAWRSATVINDLANKEIYNCQNVVPNFTEFGVI